MSHGLKVDQKVKLEPIGDVGTVVDWDEAIGYLNSLKGDKVALSVGGRYVVVDGSWVEALPPEKKEVWYNSHHWIDSAAQIWQWNAGAGVYHCLSSVRPTRTEKGYGWQDLFFKEAPGA